MTINKKNSKNIFYKIVPFIMNHWILLIFCILLTIFSALIIIIQAEFLKILMDSAVAKDLKLIKQYSGLILIMIGLNIIISYLKTHFIGTFSEKTIYDLRIKTFKDSKNLIMKYYDDHNSGDLVSRITNDLNVIKDFLQKTLVDMVYEPLIFVLSIAFMLNINIKLTVVTIIFIPMLIFLSMFVSKPIQKFSKEEMDELGKVNSLAQDIIGGIAIIKSFTLEKIMKRRHDLAVDTSIKKSLKIIKFSSLNSAFALIMQMIPFILVFGYGGYLAVKGELSYGGILAFINVTNYASRPLSSAPRIINSIRRMSAALERINEIWSEEKEKVDGEIFKANNEIAINFKNVSFGYKDGTLILKNINFQVKSGEKVALVGHSGCGKSTIFKLLTGFYEIKEGDIEIYGKSLIKWDLNEVRKYLSLVSQDNYLFPESIYDNISYGQENATNEDIKNAIKIANIDEFVNELEEGIDTLIGERGSRISGGQRQRISIARALVKNAPILLLDEATSALDINSEYEVQKGLDELLKGRTAIIISHRLSTIKNVDRIIVIEEGRIVEEGTEEILLESGKAYKELYSSQLLKEG